MEPGDLIGRCRTGDDLAWEALVRLYQGRIYSLALLYLGNEEEARDLAQEVFIRIYRHLDTCTNEETFVPWMIQIARNAAVDRIRRIRARPKVVTTPIDEMGHLPSPDPGPEEHLQRRLRVDLLRRAIGKLSRINREMVILKEIHGQSLEQIAHVLDLPIGTVKSRSHRARIELARKVLALSESECPPGGEAGP